MKVNVDFSGMPGLWSVLDKKSQFEYEFPGKTLGELVESLVRRYGRPMTKALLDSKGAIDMEIHVVLNDNGYVMGNLKKAVLSDGDTVAFKGAG